ncbi:MAG: hypothetical protein HFE58_01400 [Firmicutes bacterium]|nr:hypothetical protein [Bacillota bacterium]
MQKQNTKYTKTFLCIDIVLSIITLGYVAFVIYETNKYMYFAGFASLFMLLLLKPYFIILFQCVLLLLLSIILKKKIPMIVALILQIVCCFVWLLTVYLLHSGISWFEFLLLLHMIIAVTIVLLLWESRNERRK